MTMLATSPSSHDDTLVLEEKKILEEEKLLEEGELSVEAELLEGQTVVENLMVEEAEDVTHVVANDAMDTVRVNDDDDVCVAARVLEQTTLVHALDSLTIDPSLSVIAPNVRALVVNHPHLSLLPTGRVTCHLTQHDMKATPYEISSYLLGKKYIAAASLVQQATSPQV